MLGEVPGQDNEQLVKSIEIGDLSMRTYNITIDNIGKAEVFKASDGTPIGNFATPWLRGNSGFFRVNLIVVGPVTEEPEDYFSLSSSEAKDFFKEISNVVKFLKKELR